MEKKFTVIKDEDIRKYLDDEQLSALEDIELTIGYGRKEEGKAVNNTYLVVNTDEPYADLVEALILGEVSEDYKLGIKKSIDIIKKEIEFAKKVNPQMAMGMSQILNLLEKELKEQ